MKETIIFEAVTIGGVQSRIEGNKCIMTITDENGRELNLIIGSYAAGYMQGALQDFHEYIYETFGGKKPEGSDE